MWHFQRIDPEQLLLQPTRKTLFVSVVGAGGKTTLIEYLASRAIRQGKRVVITTTTKIWVKEPYVLWPDLRSAQARPDFVRVGKTVAEGKLTALEPEEIADLGISYDLVLIEADGSKNKPLKYPAEYEPVIPSFSDRIILIAGLDALGGQVDEQVFRWELFERATGVSGDAQVTPSLFLRFLEDDALMKGVDREKSVIVLNKYDALTEKRSVVEIAKAVQERSGVKQIIISSLQFDTFYSVKFSRRRP